MESEDVDELDGDEASIEGYINALGSMPDVQMCEVEIQGPVQEVQGDEEGLVVSTGVPVPVSVPGAPGEMVLDDTAQELDYPPGDAALVRTPDAFAPSSSLPAVSSVPRWTHSPAYSTVSMPSPQLQHNIALGHPHAHPHPAHAFTHPHPTAHGYGHPHEFVSLSAPAHKQAFDHGSLYPADLTASPSLSSSSLSSAGSGAIACEFKPIVKNLIV